MKKHKKTLTELNVTRYSGRLAIGARLTGPLRIAAAAHRPRQATRQATAANNTAHDHARNPPHHALSMDTIACTTISLRPTQYLLAPGTHARRARSRLRPGTFRAAAPPPLAGRPPTAAAARRRSRPQTRARGEAFCASRKFARAPSFPHPLPFPQPLTITVVIDDPAQADATGGFRARMPAGS